MRKLSGTTGAAVTADGLGRNFILMAEGMKAVSLGLEDPEHVPTQQEKSPNP